MAIQNVRFPNNLGFVSFATGSSPVSLDALASVTLSTTPQCFPATYGEYIARIFPHHLDSNVKIIEVTRMDGGYSCQDVATAGGSYTTLAHGMTIVLPTPLPTVTATSQAVSYFSVNRGFDNLEVLPTGPEPFDASCGEKTVVVFSGTVASGTPGAWALNCAGFASVMFSANITSSSAAGPNDGAFYAIREYADVGNINQWGSSVVSALWTRGGVAASAGFFCSKRYFVLSRLIALYQRSTGSNIVGTWYAHLSTAQSGTTV